MKKFFDFIDAVVNDSLLFQEYIKYQMFSSWTLKHRKYGDITKFLLIRVIFLLGMTIEYSW